MPNYDTIYNPVPIPNPLPEGVTLDDYKLGTYDVMSLEVLSNGEWIQLPDGAVGMSMTIATTVKEARVTSNILRTQKVGRDLSKITYKIPLLYAHEWKKILDIFDASFDNKVRYFDMQRGKIVRTMYVGDRTAEIFSYKQDLSGDVEIFANCSVNFIDCGYPNEG